MQETGNNHIQSLSLSVRLHADGFSFFCYAPSNSAEVKVEDYAYSAAESKADTLMKAVGESALIKGRDLAMVFALVTTPSMCMPLECFRKEEAPRLLRLTYSDVGACKTYYNILPHVEVAQIFGVDTEIERRIRLQFPDVRVYHSLTMVLEKMWLLERQGQRRLNVFFNEKDFFVFSFNGGALLYANTFPADAPENAAYFILSVWKDLEMNVHDDTCVLFGDGTMKANTGHLLMKYLRNVKDMKADDIYRRPLHAEAAHIPFDVQALLANIS